MATVFRAGTICKVEPTWTQLYVNLIVLCLRKVADLYKRDSHPIIGMGSSLLMPLNLTISWFAKVCMQEHTWSPQKGVENKLRCLVSGILKRWCWEYMDMDICSPCGWYSPIDTPTFDFLPYFSSTYTIFAPFNSTVASWCISFTIN